MDRCIRPIFLFFSFLVVSQAALAQKTILKDGWRLSSSNRNMELPVSVPGTLYGDLLKHGLAADVMLGENEKDIQWIEKGSWVYRNSFEADEAMLQSPHADLVFEGLDTYAKVYVNDSLVITAVNIFREWRVDIAPLLKKGTNHIAVWLLPVEELAAAARKAFPYRLPQTDTAAASSLVRKAAYHFGWDWAPRVPDRGIWKPVYIVLRDQISIRRFHVRTISANTTEALLEARFSYISDSAVLSCTAQVQGHTSVFDMQKGMGEHAFRFKVTNPKMWWPAGSGEQYLYDFTLKITKGKQAIGSLETRTGIRTIELMRDQDSIGTSFYFKVNGTPVFMKGANYVPPFQWNRSANRLKAVEDAAAVGMNMLRIWGGGIYEDDSFYSLCDEKGILIWQDLMFACAMYPGDGNFLNNVLTEVYETADRLSGHPCLAIWCGNNESDVAWKNWGWQKQYGYSASDSTAIAEAYEKLFLDNIPFGIRAADPYTPYIHSSPLSNWGKRDNFNHHNMHYWGVWHGEEAIDSFRVNVPRFMTEYGMQSFPSFNSLTDAFQSETVSIDSPLLASRQKSYKGNRLLETYIKSRYQVPASLEELCYLSQLMQADAMDIAIRSHRLAAGRCMGTLYWQLNDVWPGASWSTIEHQGIWKAAHYKLKELYSPVIIIPKQEKDSLEIYVQDTGPVPVVNGRMSIDVLNLSGDTLKSVTVNGIKSNLQAVKVFQQSVAALTAEPDNAVLSIRLFSADSMIAQTLHYFVTPDKLKLLKPEISESVSVFNHVTTIVLKSDVLAKGVFLSYAGHASHFSDNYFDLLPGVEKKVIFSSEATGELLRIRIYLNGK